MMTSQLAATIWNRIQVQLLSPQGKSAALFPTFNSHRMGNLADFGNSIFLSNLTIGQYLQKLLQGKEDAFDKPADTQRARI